MREQEIHKEFLLVILLENTNLLEKDEYRAVTYEGETLMKVSQDHVILGGLVFNFVHPQVMLALC